MEKILDELITSDSYTIYWLRDNGSATNQSIMPDDLFLYDHNVLDHIEGSDIIIVENLTGLEIPNANLPEHKRKVYTIVGVLEDGTREELERGFEYDEVEMELDVHEEEMNDRETEYIRVDFRENNVVLDFRVQFLE